MARELYLPHPLNPPLLQRRGGKIIERGASPLLDTPLSSLLQKRRGELLNYHAPSGFPSDIGGIDYAGKDSHSI